MGDGPAQLKRFRPKKRVFLRRDVRELSDRFGLQVIESEPHSADPHPVWRYWVYHPTAPRAPAITTQHAHKETAIDMLKGALRCIQ